MAVQGKLVKQDPKDEPASVLFDKIQEKKIELAKKKALQKDKKLSPISKDQSPWILPSNWRWVRLQEILEITRGGSPRPAGDPKYFGGTIPWITVREITKDHELYLTNTQDGLTEEGTKRSRFVEIGDMLLTNSGATLGVPKISKIRGCINDGVALLRQFHSGLNQRYLYYFLLQQTPAFRSVNQGMGQPNLNTPIIAGWFFPLPPRTEQNRIVDKIEQMIALCDDLEAKLVKGQAKSGKLLEAAVADLLAA